ncbi:337_t:CDS:2 [Acaulospora morrowiae]|uniref:337_t:CDS:1 n=1 Tax=Acaulospora morrowiae TaxID=94023 RepID=A0A9N9EMT2_9GLOM|nr:337_t:CDS:2 [Acaulospora morrowiae]
MKPFALIYAILFIAHLIDAFPNGNLDFSKRDNNTIVPYYYNQTIDHYDKKSGTFKQKYFVNSAFYKPGGPIFITTAGETAISVNQVKLSGISYMASLFNGLVISVEHRFYGESYPPVPDLHTKNLKTHTVEQALADFATFISNPPDVPVKIPKDSKWIFVGGSYAGSIATWMRKKYPKLVFAAWASSAPLLAKLDFFEYDLEVGHALPCHDDVAGAIKYVDSILLSGNKTAIKALKVQYGLGVLEQDRDFATAISFPVAIMVQSYFPPLSPNDIDTIPTFCGAFAKSPNKSPATLNAIYVQTFKFFLNSSKLTTDEAITRFFATSAISLAVPNDEVTYYYQSCTQFGWSTTAPRPPHQSLRPQIVNVAGFQALCNFLFPGIPSLQVKKTNHELGGNKGTFSRTVFTTGGHDPWTPLTISGSDKHTISKNSVFVIINGSHTNDLRYPSSVDSASLTAARKFVKDNLSEWLKKY